MNDAVASPTNADRARWAELAVKRFQEVCLVDDEDAIADLIVDLCHLARRRSIESGIAFSAVDFLSDLAGLHDAELAEDQEAALAQEVA